MAAPNLRVFYLSPCCNFRSLRTFGFGSPKEYIDGTDNKLLRVVAPKLEEIACMDYFSNKPADLASVRRLTDLRFKMHGKYHRNKDGVGFWLVENCPNVEHVDVHLSHMSLTKLAADEQLVGLTSEGKAPCERLTFPSVILWDACRLCS